MVVGILAAILTPIAGSMIDDARATSAERDAREIARAVQNFRKNTGKWPIFVSGVSSTTSFTVYDVLLGPGNDPQPAGSAWLTDNRGDWDAILVQNTPDYTTSGSFKWCGPCVAEPLSDPWGNAYLINTKNLKFGVKEAGLVLSAGPNGTTDNTFQQTIGAGSSAAVIGSDDIAAASVRA